MGMYSDNIRDEDFGIDMDALVEAFIIDDLTHNYGEDTIKEFCAAGGVGEALLEAKVLSNKRTLMRLSKESDLERRKVIAAIQMARAKNDPLFAKLVKHKLLFKQDRQKIVAHIHLDLTIVDVHDVGAQHPHKKYQEIVPWIIFKAR